MAESFVVLEDESTSNSLLVIEPSSEGLLLNESSAMSYSVDSLEQFSPAVTPEFNTPQTFFATDSQFVITSTPINSSLICKRRRLSFDTMYTCTSNSTMHHSSNSQPHSQVLLETNTPVTTPDDLNNEVLDGQLLATHKCCHKNCLQNLPSSVIETAKIKFTSRSVNDQNQYLLNCFELGSAIEQSSPSFHMFEGYAVCRSAFQSILSLSSKRYQRVYQQYSKGILKFEKKQKQKRGRESF